MELTTFLIGVFCLIDDWPKDRRIRQRVPQPRLADSEVLTNEIVGEILGIDTDVGLFAFFGRHYGDWLPVLCQVDRNAFTVQADKLCVAKEQLFAYLSQMVPHDPLILIVNIFPKPVCRFAHAKRFRSISGQAAFGYDEVARQTCYALRRQARICWPGVILASRRAPADMHDTQAAEELREGAQGWMLGDRN